MKKILSLVLVLCICVSFAACNATDPNNLFAMTTVAATASTDCETVSFEEPQTGNEYYQYGNMQKNLPPGDYMLVGNQVLFQWLSNGDFRLYCYDLTTGEVASYCKDATCKHNNCVASGLLGTLEVYKGRTYSMTATRQIVEIKDNEQVLIHKAQVNGFRHYDDKLYIKTADSALVVFEEGIDEPQIIVEEFTGFWEVIFGQYMYANDIGSVIRIDLEVENPSVEVLVPNANGITDGQHIYYADLKNYYLYRCDMDGSNSELLLEQPVLPASWNFDEEYFYYRLYTDHQLDDGPDTYDIYRFPKSDPTEVVKIATLPVPVYQIFTVPGTGKVFVESRIRTNGEDFDLYIMNTDGSNITRLEIPEY